MTTSGIEPVSDNEAAHESTLSDFHDSVEPPRMNGRIVRDVARAEVVARYARTLPSGRPMYCKPSREERSGEVVRKQGPGTDGKVIYPNKDAADAAGRELEALGGRPLRPYACKRSRNGHFHLTTDRSAHHHWPLVTATLPSTVAGRLLSRCVTRVARFPGVLLPPWAHDGQ